MTMSFFLTLQIAHDPRIVVNEGYALDCRLSIRISVRGK
jgi:hypothetical protein